MQNAANIPLKTVTSLFLVPTIFNNNNFFLYLSNTVQEIITCTSQNLDAETLQLIKKRRCFNCKEKGHKPLNCPKKAKISIITDTSNMNNIENIDLKKE